LAILIFIPHNFKPMFNKSIFAAALLTVGAIAGGSAASAAEIGVQSTWGHSHTAITNGEFRSETTAVSAYAERSRVDVLGWNEYGDVTTTTDVAPEGAEYVLVDEIPTATQTVDVDAREDRSGLFPILFSGSKSDVQDVEVLDTDALAGVTRTGEATSVTTAGESGGQLSWARAGRLELGGSFSRTTDNYDYTGTRTSGFSGVTAFTR